MFLVSSYSGARLPANFTSALLFQLLALYCERCGTIGVSAAHAVGEALIYSDDIKTKCISSTSDLKPSSTSHRRLSHTEVKTDNTYIWFRFINPHSLVRAARRSTTNLMFLTKQ